MIFVTQGRTQIVCMLCFFQIVLDLYLCVLPKQGDPDCHSNKWGGNEVNQSSSAMVGGLSFFALKTDLEYESGGICPPTSYVIVAGKLPIKIQWFDL